MTIPNLLPCPDCGSAEHIGIFKYDGGYSRVECDPCGLGSVGCGYMGPAMNTKLDAVRDHNSRVRKALAKAS